MPLFRLLTALRFHELTTQAPFESGLPSATRNTRPRNKIGLDVVLEALRQARRMKKATVNDLWQYAKLNRVANVMRPYLEALA